jgi:hypothetical protein
MGSRSARLLPALLAVMVAGASWGCFPKTARAHDARQTTATPTGIPATSDEFVGPFSSWTNVQSVYGATGDGVTDDTAAIQKALNDLSASAHSSVLYFPAGTYQITATLSLAHAIDISLIGADPAVTKIVWAGPANGVMLYLNGVAYSKFSRLTFDGSSTALVAVDQSYDGKLGYFDTGNEYSDDSFTNAGYGIRGGALDFGFAETSVLRSHFTGNWVAGIAVLNYNALDLWVWYSTFQNCNVGVTNYIPVIVGAGNFHVYYSNFSNSRVADLEVGNTGGFSARGNFSSGSAYFFLGAGATNNPATIDIVGNTILDSTNANGTAIGIWNQGPGFVMNNVIRTLAGKPGPAVSWGTFSNDQDLESVGNTFTTSNSIFIGPGELIETGDQVVASSSVNPTAPILPGTLPTMNRQVFEVAPGASASDIQSVINLAAAQNGNRAVVHIPYGAYKVNQTIVVPPSDIQIVGDGYGIGSGGTSLGWAGSGNGPVFQVNGPSQATLRDVGIKGTATADGLLISNIDQSGSRVYMDQAHLTGCTQWCLAVSGLDNLTVAMENMGISGPSAVTGGPLSASGATTRANVNIFSGSGGNYTNGIMFDVSQGGKLLVRDWWNDGSGTAHSPFANVHGSASLTIDGCMLYQVGQGTPSVQVTDLNGKVAILTSGLGYSSGVGVSGNGTNSAILGMGLNWAYVRPPYFADTTSPSGTTAMLNLRGPVKANNGSGPVPNMGSASPSFLTAMLGQAGGQNPAVLSSLPSGVSDVRFFRVAVVGGRTNLNLTGRPGDFVPPRTGLKGNQ